MDDDLFQFEAPPEAAPELVLGKKKKKKKKKKDDDVADGTLEIAEGAMADVNGDASATVNGHHDDAPPALDLPTKKKKKKTGASMASASAFDSHEDGMYANGDAQDANDHTAADATSAFAALSIHADDDKTAMEVDHSVVEKKKKKKKKRIPDMDIDDDASAQMSVEPEEDSTSPRESDPMGNPPAPDASPAYPLEAGVKRPISTAEKKKAKKERERQAKLEKAKQDDAELDNILAELGETPPTEEAPQPVEDAAPLTAAQKKRLKKKKKAAGDRRDNAVEPSEPAAGDEVDALLEELSVPAAAPSVVSQPLPAKAEGPGQSTGDVDDLLAELAGEGVGGGAKKKGKKKKKKGDAKADGKDEVDALLAELSGTPAPDHPAEDVSAANDVPPGPAPGVGGDVDVLLAELAGDDGGAAAKKKAKKKKKKGGAKAEADVGEAGEADTVEAETATPVVEAKKPKKKESAAVRKMREARERMLAEEERLRKLKEEEEARIEAEERAREEEERLKEEAKLKKKAADKAKKERKRQEGTFLSKSAREKKRKAEQLRKQLIERGLVPAVAVEVEPEASKQPVYSRKRNNAREREEDGAATTAEGTEVAKEDGTAGDKAAEEKIEGAVPEPPAPVVVVPDDWDLEEGKAGAFDESKTEKVDTSNVRKALAAKAPDGGDVEIDADDNDDDNDDDDDDGSGGGSGSGGSEYEGMSKAEIAAEKRVDLFRKQRAKEKETALASRTAERLRSPVICILGHVDTGKTKILDKIRRTNVQDGEAGGITQQIGATYFPIDAVKKEATKLKEGKELDYNVPSLLIIDTPGHESFTNLRSRGSSLCDIAILVVDIMHGLEPQTRESIDLLKLRKTPFIVALNKIDRIYDWNEQPHNCPTRESLAKQPSHAQEEFKRRVRETQLEFSEIGFNTKLYWENEDVRRTVSIVPTSAISGEGIPDLLMLLLALPQRLLTERLMFNPLLEATVLEVKVIEGLGTTIDIILTGGTIQEGDTIMVVGLDGPIVATIRALLTPHPMKEMRVKGQYLHHKKLEAAQGIKISADGLEKAVAGTQLMVVGDPNNEEEMEYVRDEVMKDFQTIVTNVDKSGLGVYVQASTLGSLEALLEFLRTSQIPVSGINIGPVHKRDVTKASTMLEKRKEFATILAFDVPVEREAKELAEESGVRIFTADIIYHLFDRFTAYMEEVKKQRREQVNDDVVFPSISKILPQHVYNKKDPIVVGVDVMDGILRIGTPLVVHKGDAWLDIGRVASIELNKKQVVTARKGESVAVKIQHKSTEHIMYGRHFDFKDTLVSKMSRSAIDLLKESFRDDLATEDWRLVVKLKKMFDII